jgi:hypothetical protein
VNTGVKLQGPAMQQALTRTATRRSAGVGSLAGRVAIGDCFGGSAPTKLLALVPNSNTETNFGAQRLTN